MPYYRVRCGFRGLLHCVNECWMNVIPVEMLPDYGEAT